MRRCGLVLTVLLAPVAGCATSGPAAAPASGRVAPITVDAAPASGGPLRSDAPRIRPSVSDTADYLATLTTARVRPRSSTTQERPATPEATTPADTTGEGVRSWSADTWVDYGLAACGRLHDADGDVAAVTRAVRNSLPTTGGYGWSGMTAAERSTLIVTTAAEELCPDVTAR